MLPGDAESLGRLTLRKSVHAPILDPSSDDCCPPKGGPVHAACVDEGGPVRERGPVFTTSRGSGRRTELQGAPRGVAFRLGVPDWSGGVGGVNCARSTGGARA